MKSQQPSKMGRKISMPARSATPGLKRGRHRLPYWIAKQVVRDPMGFPDPCIALPADADDATIALHCQEHTARLLAHVEEQKKREQQLEAEEGAPALHTRYDGTVLAACRVYQEHPYSNFHTVSESTRVNAYLPPLRLLERTVGKRLIRNLTAADVKHWYAQWRKPVEAGGPERIDRAHDAAAMFRTVIYFLSTLAPRSRYADCKTLASDLEKVTFEKGGAREEELTYQQATAFILKAVELGDSGVIPSQRARIMAIGVAAQFELMLRQKDIIGGWQKRALTARVPQGMQVIHAEGRTWTGYFTWENIPGWRWRMKTSKSKYRAAADFDLTSFGLLFPLLERVPHTERAGPIVKGEEGLPIVRGTYSRWFRRIARAAGIPDAVWNMDARAGGATEGYEAGADLGALQSALTHEDSRTTLRYVRRRSAGIADVAEARQRSRKQPGTS